MKKAAHWILVIFICALALGGAYVGFVLMIASGFIFGNIDHTEAQRQAAENKALISSLFGFVSFCIAILIMFLSSRIARLMLRVLGVGGAT
jgi:hypothetical protein